MKLTCAADLIDAHVDRQVYEAVDSTVPFNVWIKIKHRVMTKQIVSVRDVWRQLRDEEEHRNAIH